MAEHSASSLSGSLWSVVETLGIRNEDIKVYIVFKGDKLPICRRCLSKIAEKDLEW